MDVAASLERKLLDHAAMGKQAVATPRTLSIHHNFNASNARYGGTNAAPLTEQSLYRKVHAGDAHAVAESMTRAMQRESGAFGKYDAARKVFQDAETGLLCGIARGDKGAAQRLDMLRKSPLSFAQSMNAGIALDYSPGTHMNSRGDFNLPTKPREVHPAMRGELPRIIPLAIRCNDSARGDDISARSLDLGQGQWSARPSAREPPCTSSSRDSSMSARDSARTSTSSTLFTHRSSVPPATPPVPQAPMKASHRRQLMMGDSARIPRLNPITWTEG